MKKVLMWLIIFAVLLMGGNISAFEPLFEARIDYSLDYGPQSVTSADFDGDGDYDLATVGGNNISIFLNNCNGTFAKPINYTAGYNLRSVTSADFDGDNDYDLAVASWEYTGHISILLNNGDGTFAEAINYTTGYRASSIISEDFDGDGDYDLAAASAGSYEYEGSLAILMNNGDGTFSEPIYYMAGEEVGSAISADFDGDGDYDLAAAVGFTFFILLNDGNGNFAESANFTVGFQPENLISADLDGDNDCDLVIGKYHHMSVLLNYGDGTFTDPIDYTGDFGNPSISTDTDGDGDFDVVATFGDGVSDRVSLLQNNGDGTFAEPIQYAASGVANKVLAADFDNNGFNDLAVICYFGEFLSSGGISVMINKGDGTFVAATPMGVIGTGVISADLDLDGDYDLAAAGNTTLSILQNNGNGIFADPLNYAMDSGFKSICAADFNGDSNIDLATVNNSCKFIFDYPNPGWVLSVVGSLDIMLNNGNGTFTSSYDSTWSVWGYDPYYWPNGSEDLSSIVSADFNGDIKNDLAMVMGWRNDVIICQNTGNGAFAGQFPIGIGVKQRSICSADFDGDDNNDLATGGGSISILLNDGAGAFTDPIYYLIGEDVRFVISVDFDGDGNYDLAAAKGFGVSILLNDGDGNFVTAYDYAAGYYPSSIFAYDFDNDGNIDLAVSNQGSNNVSILLGNGDGSFIEPYYSYGVLNSGTYGYGRQSVHGSDFDGDNDCDLIVGGNVSILFNQIDVRDRWAVIAIDRSGSMFHPDPLGQSRLERAKSMAHDEIDQLVDFSDPVYSGINQVAIMSFNSDGIVVEQDFTSNSSDLHNAIDQIANPRHDTPLAAAMCQAHCMLTDFNATAKYVFTFTDGLENGSEYFNICDICDPCSYLMETGWNYDCDISNPSSCTQWQLCLAEQFAPTGTNIVHYFGEPINPLDKGSTGLEDMYFLRSTAEEGDGAFFYHSDQVANGYLCGDANHDFSVNTSDAVTIINYIFAGGDPPDPFISGDTNCDEIVNVSDAVYIINFIFMGGHEPCFDCPQ